MTVFGTDGIRGRAGEGLLTPETITGLASGFGIALGGGGVAVARDTRESGGWIRDAVVDGLRGVGADVSDLGVLPTPALSHAIAADSALVGGVMITASHNPWHDNGLKLFGGDGTKASDAVQAASEGAWRAGITPAARRGTTSDRDGASARAAYLESLQGARVDHPIVLDDAAGAAAGVLLEALGEGSDRIALAPAPDGRNINAGIGAVHPEATAARVLESGAWGGIVLDGDGDRIAIVDELGTVHDGDAILGFLAASMQAEGSLRGGAVVGTVMTNGGLEAYLAERGLGLIRTPVGDRHVSAAMIEHGCNLGGETSGHVLTPDRCPTGDGLRVGLHVLRVAAAAGKPLSVLLGGVPRFPSASRKVPDGGHRPPIDRLLGGPQFRPVLDRIGDGGGRPLVRYSGTEPYLRIQVEGPSTDLVEAWADQLAQAAGGVLGG